MPQIINTNIASLTAQRNLNSSQSANRTALERLSSGLRINSAKDDAAGLAISTRFSSQIRGLSVAIRNAGDGISLAQTAEGALDSITSSLQRLRELALQSSNATNSDVDREALNAEAQQLISEITRTGEQTDFNGTNLLDGNFAASFQVGANSGETVSFGIAELTSANLGGGRTAGVSAIGSNAGLSNGDLVINGAVVGPSVASDDTSSFSNAPASAISKVAAINRTSDSSGVVAEVLTNIAAGSVQNAASGGGAATTGSITLNGVEISVATGDVDESADRSGIVAAINARSGETGVTAVDTGTRFGGVNLEASDGRNITLEFSSGTVSAASTGLTSTETSTGGFTLSSKTSGSAIVISESTGSISNSGLAAGTYTANTAAVSSTVRTSEDGAPVSQLDTPAVAASVTSTGTGTLGNYSGVNTLEFDITISNADSSSENGTVTVSVSDDLTGGSTQDLADAINSSINGAIAATATVDSDGNLQISRDTAEAGTIELRNFGDNGSTSAAVVASALGVAENTAGQGANVVAADTVVDAVAASTTGSSSADASALGATVLSASNSISFDISISGANSQAAQSISVTLGAASGINSLSTASDIAGAINSAISSESSTIGVTATVDADNAIVFTRDLAESGTLEISGVDGTGVSDAVASQVLGYSLDTSGTGTVSTNGANATTVGAVNAAANYFSSGNSFEAGASSATALTFETGSAESAVLTIGTGVGSTPTSTGVNLSAAGAIAFEVSLDNGEAFTVTTAAVASATDATQAELVSALNTAFDTATTALGIGNSQIFASVNDGVLQFETGAKGSAKSLEITAVTGSVATDTLGLADVIGVQATGLGGTEAAQVTVAQGNTPDYGFDFNGSVTRLATGDSGTLVDRDNLSFDISVDENGTITNSTVTVDQDSSPRGAQLTLALTANTGGGAISGTEATGIAATEFSVDLTYNGISGGTITNTVGAAATGAAFVADIQTAVDAAFLAGGAGTGDVAGTGAGGYANGDIIVSLDANSNVVFTTKSTTGNESLAITASAGANAGVVTAITALDGTTGTTTIAASGAGVYAGDGAAQTSFAGGSFVETANYSVNNVTFDITLEEGGLSTGPSTVTFAYDGTGNSVNDAIDALQTAVDTAVGANKVVVGYDSANDDLVFSTVATGSDAGITIDNFTDAAASDAGLGTLGVAASSFTGAGTDFDADAAFLNTVNDAISATGVSGKVTASIDVDSNLVFETALTGEDVTLTVGNFVGSADALAAAGVSGTERAFGPEISQDVSLASTATDFGGTGATGVDLSGAAGVGYSFSLSFNGGTAVTVADAGGGVANATANQLVQDIQSRLNTALSAATVGDGASGYTDGDVVVSINNGGELVLTNTRTDSNASLEIVNGNVGGTATEVVLSSSGTVTPTSFTAGGAQASIKEATGTAVDATFDFNAVNAGFDISFDDGSGSPAVTGTVALSAVGFSGNVTADDFISDLQAALDTATGNTGDITASLDKDGFLTFTSENDAGSGVSFTIDNFTGTSASLGALGLGDGTATPYANLTFTESGTDTNIVTNPAGTVENDEGRDQPDQNDTLTITGLQGGDETVTLSGSFSDRASIVAELNDKLSNATASLSETGVITITDDDISQASDGNTVGVSGNAAADLGFDGNGNASAGVINTAVGGAGSETQSIRTLLDGDLRLNGVSIAASRASDDTASNELANSSSKSASGIAIAAAINRTTDTTGVTATVNATVVTGGTTNTDRTADGDAGEVYINGISAGTLALGTDKETNRANAISAINQIAGQTGVSATDNGGGITLTAADGRNVSVAIDTKGTNFTGQNIGLDASVQGIAEADFAGQGTTYAEVAATTSSTIRLESSKEFTVGAGTNGAVGSDGFGGLEGLGIRAGTYGGAESGQFLNEVDISTVEGAISALDALDNALTSVSSERANLGAIQNRLQSTIDNLSISAENLQSANSRILDADFAAETAELSRTQVLQQAGISILAQANAAPQQVLSLLQ